MEELDLKELLDLFWSKIFQIILIVAIAIGLGGVYTYGFVVPKYTSSTKLLLIGAAQTEEVDSTNSITATDVTLNSKLVSTYRELITGENILKQVISNLNIDMTKEQLKSNIKVNAVQDTEVIEISVTNENAAYAAKIANEIVNVFSGMVAEVYNIHNIYVVNEAEVSSVPSNIHHSKDIIIFAFYGLIVAVAYVLIGNMLDTTIKTPEDIENGINLPVLVSVPLIENFNTEKGGKKK